MKGSEDMDIVVTINKDDNEIDPIPTRGFRGFHYRWWGDDTWHQ